MRDLRHDPSIVERWFAFPLAEQLGHVGSEVSRALNWRSRNPEIATGALHRALELWLDFLVGPNQYASSAESLRRYFDAFGVAAVNGRARSRTPAGS